VTQGANPIEVYDGVTVSSGAGGATCLTPGKKILAGSTQVTLANYSPQAIVNPLGSASTYTIPVTVTIPPSGNVFLAIHMDYGLKGSTGYTKGGVGGNDAMSCSSPTTPPPLIPDIQTYNFSVAAASNDPDDPHLSDVASATSCNAFKKSPGTAGHVERSLSLNPVPNCNVVLKDSKGLALGNVLTDIDGVYMINYKWTGKAATFTVTLTPPGGTAQTKTITLKANGFIEVDFIVP
jgi:hypothetical protein